MSLPLSPASRRDVQDALRAVLERASDAYGSDDLADIRRHLVDVWHAVHVAHEAVSQAERDTRAHAMAALNQRKVA